MNQPGVVTLDVRRYVYHGEEPFGAIMAAVAQLKRGQKFLLLAPFEPVPLFRVMAARGFTYTAHQAPSGRHWEILFERSDESAPDGGSNGAPPAESRPIEIDARGLEPPMPMVRILEVIEALSGEAHVVARTDRRPAFLLAELPRRGFSGQTEEASDGGYITHISRA